VTCSGQVLPRHTGGAPYRCSLPGLAGFDASRCVGPNPQRRPVRLIRHERPSKREFNPAVADCGLQGTATSPSSTAKRHQDIDRKRWRGGWDSNPRYSCPYTAFPVPHLRPLGHPSLRPPRDGRRVIRSEKILAEGRGFEPPRDLRPYPISSRTPSTGLG